MKIKYQLIFLSKNNSRGLWGARGPHTYRGLIAPRRTYVVFSPAVCIAITLCLFRDLCSYRDGERAALDFRLCGLIWGLLLNSLTRPLGDLRFVLTGRDRDRADDDLGCLLGPSLTFGWRGFCLESFGCFRIRREFRNGEGIIIILVNIIILSLV